MSLYIETYAVVSYEEMMEARKKANEYTLDAVRKYKNFLITCLCEAGLADKAVILKREGVRGALKVVETPYSSYSPNHPYEIKFYPYRKNGEVSLNHKFVNIGYSNESDLVERLINIFESSGDENES